MVSQKNNDLKSCIHCKSLLEDTNWAKWAQKRGTYVCTPCRRIQEKKRISLDPNYSKKQRSRHRMRRSAVIFHYGNQCNQCGEDDYTKLTIDHINGGGNAHRKEMKTNIVDYLYNHLIDKDGYQILCFNCNCSKNVQYKDKYALKDKMKSIEAYGNFCKDCGEDRIERLTIDHKNNDGAIQRKKLKCFTGVRMYRWLIKNNFPENLGLQVLCFNCNCSKRSAAKYEADNLL